MKNRPLLLLTHFLVVTTVPLILTLTIYLLLQGNSAEFIQASWGVKLAGPIAAYAALVFGLDRLSRPIFGAWRDEDLHRRRLREAELSDDEAIAATRRFSHLMASFIATEVMLYRRLGYGPDGFDQVMSILRKEVIGFQQVVGGSTIARGQYKLADILGAMMKDPEFKKGLDEDVAAFLALTEADIIGVIEPYPQYDNQRPPANATREEIVDYVKRATDALAEIRQHEQTTGLHRLVNSMRNRIWKFCEAAIMDPSRYATGSFGAKSAHNA